MHTSAADPRTEEAGTQKASTGSAELSAALRVVRSDLNALVRGVDPKEVELTDAVGVWEQFTGLAKLASAGAMLVAARAAQARAAAGRGAGGPAEQAARDAGTSTGRARAEAEASKRLEGLEATAEELRAGRLSPEQAGAIADAADVNPDCEQDLIDLAQRESLRRLKEEAARRKAERDDLEERERRVRRERSARSWVKDGRWNFFAHGPLPEGADVDTALQRYVAEHFSGSAVPDAEREPTEAHAFDGFIDLARRAMAGQGGSTGADHGDAAAPGGRSSPGGPAATRTRERPNRMAILRIDLTAFLRGHVTDGEVCEIVGLGPVSVDAARSMMGDCLLKAVLTHGSKVAGVVHLNRVPTVAQKLALLWMSPTCTTEGCDNRVGLEIDHRIDWAVTKHTRIEELEHECGRCHDKKTREGYALAAGTGRRPLVPPDDPRHPDNDPSHPDHGRVSADERRELMARARRAVDAATRPSARRSGPVRPGARAAATSRGP